MIEQLTDEQVRALKAKAEVRIAAGLDDVGAMRMVDKTDHKVGGNRLRKYLTSLLQGEHHNVYEQLAGAQFFDLLKRYTYKPSATAKVVILFESLPMASADGRKYTHASESQVFEIARIYGFYRTAKLRLTTDVLLFVPRKYGKTTMCAVFALEDALLGDRDAEAYISANKYDQSKICFKSVSKFAKALDAGYGNFHFTRDTIDVLLPNRESLIRCLSYAPDKLDGLKASVCIYDELSQADSMDQKNVIKTSMGTRSQPLTIDITTASAKIEGPFVEELEAYKRMLRGEIDNDRVFAHIFEPDVFDDEGDPNTWKKVNPHIGVTVRLDFYRNMWDDAKIGYENLKDFRTKLLNKFVTGEIKSWYEMEAMLPLMKPFEWDAINAQLDGEGDELVGVCAVDLSVRGDLSAATYMAYSYSRGRFYSKTQYFLPEGSINRSENRQLYADWVDKGWLTVLPGNAVDGKYIADAVAKENEHLRILKIGYDAYKSRDFVNAMTAYGAEKVLEAVPQTMSHFTAAVGKMGLLVDREALTLDENPITPWCFCNSVLAEDGNGNCKPMKKNKSSASKIDGAITNLMCLILFGKLGIG